MRVVVDYGLNIPFAKPPTAQAPRGAAARPDSGAAAGADGTDGSRTVTRRESVMVVNFGPAREDAAERAGIHPGGARASGPGGGAAGPATGAAGVAGNEGIPIPGTPYELTTSEDAKARDRAVRGHEQAHLLSLGPYAASGVTLSTRLGPDGERYAVGGSIRADLS
ncbi:MAG: putative metalloprotease CJM1_0395 family protein, partial [Spirochaetia bacterium]